MMKNTIALLFLQYLSFSSAGTPCTTDCTIYTEPITKKQMCYISGYCYEYDTIGRKCNLSTGTVWSPTSYGLDPTNGACCPSGAFGPATTAPNTTSIVLVYKGVNYNCVQA